MITVSVKSDLDKAMAQLRSVSEAKQFRFAVARALSKTGYEVQAEVRRNMPSRFTIRRNWVIQGIRVERATPANLEVTIYSRDKFMGLQEVGGGKGPLGRYLAIPTGLVRRTKTDIIAKSDRPKALGDRAEIIDFKGNKWLALKRGRKGNSGNKLRLLYLLVPRATIRERLGLARDGRRVARARFLENLKQTLEDALMTSR